MRIADTLSIGILNAYCGNGTFLVATPDRGSFRNTCGTPPLCTQISRLLLLRSTRAVILTLLPLQ